MQLTLELPDDLARLLGADPATVRQFALESLALEGIRAGKLTVAQSRRLLGITSRYEMDGFLKSHDLMLPATENGIDQDAKTALLFKNY